MFMNVFALAEDVLDPLARAFVEGFDDGGELDPETDPETGRAYALSHKAIAAIPASNAAEAIRIIIRSCLPDSEPPFSPARFRITLLHHRGCITAAPTYVHIAYI